MLATPLIATIIFYNVRTRQLRRHTVYLQMYEWILWTSVILFSLMIIYWIFRFDFILVDGGHWFENAFIDLFFALRLVKPGGLVAIDDVWMPAVQHAVRYATTNLGATQETRADLPESKRFALLRAPMDPPKRAWDHFVPFAG